MLTVDEPDPGVVIPHGFVAALLCGQMPAFAVIGLDPLQQDLPGGGQLDVLDLGVEEVRPHRQPLALPAAGQEGGFEDDGVDALEADFGVGHHAPEGFVGRDARIFTVDVGDVDEGQVFESRVGGAPVGLSDAGKTGEGDDLLQYSGLRINRIRISYITPEQSPN